MSKYNTLITVLLLVVICGGGYFVYTNMYRPKGSTQNTNQQVNDTPKTPVQNSNDGGAVVDTNKEPVAPVVEQEEEVDLTIKEYYSTKYGLGIDFPSGFAKGSKVNFAGPDVDTKSINLTQYEKNVSTEPQSIKVDLVSGITNLKKFVDSEAAKWKARGAVSVKAVTVGGEKGYLISAYDGIKRYFVMVPDSKNVLSISFSYWFSVTDSARNNVEKSTLNSVLFK